VHCRHEFVGRYDCLPGRFLVVVGCVFCADFQDLFPDRDLSHIDASDNTDHLTVITLSQRTQNDMTSWNDDVEQERENLLQNVSVSHTHTHTTVLRLCGI